MRWVETKKALGGGGDKQAAPAPSHRVQNDQNYTPDTSKESRSGSSQIQKLGKASKATKKALKMEDKDT